MKNFDESKIIVPGQIFNIQHTKFVTGTLSEAAKAGDVVVSTLANIDNVKKAGFTVKPIAAGATEANTMVIGVIAHLSSDDLSNMVDHETTTFKAGATVTIITKGATATTVSNSTDGEANVTAAMTPISLPANNGGFAGLIGGTVNPVLIRANALPGSLLVSNAGIAAAEFTYGLGKYGPISFTGTAARGAVITINVDTNF